MTYVGVNFASKKISNKKWDSYSLSPQARAGDHMWYITDFSKFQNHFPSWQLTHSIDQIIEEIVKSIVEKGVSKEKDIQ